MTGYKNRLIRLKQSPGVLKVSIRGRGAEGLMIKGGKNHQEALDEAREKRGI